MSKATSTASRLRELYRDGGVGELWRGIRDYLLIDMGIPVEKATSSVPLSAGGVEVAILTDTSEALWRAGGHGERAVQADIVERVSDSDRVWDVGANIGTYGLLCAQAGADVVAFEPGPQARAALVSNAERNDIAGRINATPYALADYDGQGVLLPAERAGVRQLARDGDEGDTVPVRRGDGLDLPAPDIIKIDVEGAEVAVIDGMADTLARARSVYIEIHEGVAREVVRDRLADAGLAVVETWHQHDDENLIVRAVR